MSTHIAERFAAGWSSQDPAAFATLFTPDCQYDDVPLDVSVRGRDAIAEHLRDWLSSSSDIVMSPLRIFDAGERVGLEWSYTGTHDGPMRDIAPTGRAFRFRGASLFEVDGELISACVDYWDLAHLLDVLRAP
ncbi:MAG: hypothetical protein QOG77_3200 [Solirubrobacteraceae bacterium]|nr:hypothetical protein [Solirubrobacteraceae bacterium]